LRNLTADKKYAAEISQLTQLLDRWAEDTGDTIPKNPTPNRQAPEGKRFKGWKHGTQPGTSRGATKINHPGPVQE
jgi:arylsulfatase